MIDESQYRLPRHEQPKPKHEDDGHALEYLDKLDFRPMGYEW